VWLVEVFPLKFSTLYFGQLSPLGENAPAGNEEKRPNLGERRPVRVFGTAARKSPRTGKPAAVAGGCSWGKECVA